MHWVADEGVERQIVERLRAAGQDVLYVAELDPGISDTEVLRRANEQGAVLITADKDFGELVFRQGQVMEGVVLLRLAGLSPDVKADLAAPALIRHAVELTNAFSVFSPGGLRIRPRQP
jgi:predicted nuclease of predicted toxin-antitoxin system